MSRGSGAASCLIPHVLETGRLRLRPFEHDDWRAIASMAGHWLLRGYGPYAVEEKATGTVLGAVRPWYPLEWPEPEIKWALARRHWGKGYASEAVRAVQRMAHQHLPQLRLISLISLIDSRNEASIRSFWRWVPGLSARWRSPARRFTSTGIRGRFRADGAGWRAWRELGDSRNNGNGSDLVGEART